MLASPPSSPPRRSSAMDGPRFDRLARFLARPASRRQTFRVVAAGAVGGLFAAARPGSGTAAPDGCCKCVGKVRDCKDTANLRDCRTYCGVNDDNQVVFSENHTCKKG